ARSWAPYSRSRCRAHLGSRLASREVPAELAAARCWRWGCIGASHRSVSRRALFRPLSCFTWPLVSFNWASWSAISWSDSGSQTPEAA
ncbi:hypothetical protein HaLaN_24222, partial [Haematococcus lacustris]